MFLDVSTSREHVLDYRRGSLRQSLRGTNPTTKLLSQSNGWELDAGVVSFLVPSSILPNP